jgi:hypothetical protein
VYVMLAHALISAKLKMGLYIAAQTFLLSLFTLHRTSNVYIIQLYKICIANVSSPSAIGILLQKLSTLGFNRS